MALNFPAGPANGDTFVGPDGAVWKWDGVKWIAVPGLGTPGAGTVTKVFQGTGLTAAPNPIVDQGTITLKPATASVLGGIIAGSGTAIDVNGLLTVAAAFNGGTVANLTTFQNGISFGSTFATPTNPDLSHHIALYGSGATAWGFNVMNANINVVTNGTITTQFNNNGISSPIGIGGAGPMAGAFTTLTASSTVSGTGFTNLLAPYSLTTHTHTASQVTDFSEAVDDRVAALLVQGANTTLTYNDAANTLTIASTGGSSNITSVAQTFTGGLISVSGSPITTGAGTLALSVAGTTGGVPYFSSASAWGTSNTLGLNYIVLGGGNGSPPFTSNNYSVNGAGLLALGQANTTAGNIILYGSTSGSVSINVNPIAGAWGLTLPATTGSNGQVLTTNGSGVTTWTTVSGSGIGEAPTGSGVSYMRNNSGWVSGGTLTGQLLAATGSITAPGISFAGDTNTGIYRPVAGHVRIAGAASDVVNFAGTPKLTTFFGPTVLYADPDGTRPLEAVTLQYLDSQMTTIATSAVGYFQAQTASQTAPPNSGSIKWNTTDLTVATQLFISKTSGNNTDITYALAKLQVGWVLRIQKKIDNSRYIWHNIIASAPVDSGTYYTVNVSLGTGAYLGMPFVNGEQVILTIDSSASAGSFLPIAGGVMTGMIGLPTTTPTASQAVRKDYVDTAISGVSGAGISSVAQTFTGGIISVAGSPVVAPNGTLALTVAGQSGGVPYFATNSTWASSAFLANNRIVLGGGPGSPPFTSANYTTDNSGGMTLGTANSIVGTLLLQSSVTNPGSLALAGITSGAVLVRNNNTAAATYNFNLPSTAGSAGQVLTSQAGGTNAMTWTTPGSGGLTSVGLSFTGGIVSVANSPLVANGTLAMTVAGTSGGIPYFDTATSWSTSTQLASNSLVLGAGSGGAPWTHPSYTVNGAGVLYLGQNNTQAGALGIYSSTSGGVVINSAATSSGYNFTLPATAGTTGQVLTSAAGAAAMTWTTPAASGIPEAPTGSGTSYIRTDSAWTSGGKFTSPLQLPIGSSSAVALNFGTTNTGLYQNASGYLQFTIAGSSKLQLGPTFVNILQQAQAVDGSQGAPSYAFASEIQSGMYWASANNVRITVQSTDVVNFSGTGGRNTTFYGPILTQANPATALEVANKQYTDNRTLQTITVSNSSADTMPTGVYDLGVFWVATTVNSSVAHVTSGTGTYTLSLGAVGSLTAITGISGVTTTSTTDTTATASALNVASAGQHLWLTISGTAAPGFCVSIKATIN